MTDSYFSRAMYSKRKFPSKSCIYKAPEHLRQTNDRAYTPLVVSIGPLHHGREELKVMEDQKLRCQKEFLQRTRISYEELFNFIAAREEQLRGCYAETIVFEGAEFVKIFLADAIFIIEVLLKSRYPELQEEHDHIFRQPYLMQNICYDMCLLENQLPFFIVEDLFNLALGFLLDDSIITLNCNFFKSLAAVEGNLMNFDSPSEIQHFTDFLRICLLPSVHPSTWDRRTNVISAPSAIQLHQAGVKFRPGSSKVLLDIIFMEGTLKIPSLKLQRGTESLFLNLIAFERCHYESSFINDYVVFMHQLVKTPEDVELLVKNGIIDSRLPDTETAATIFNNLSKGTTVDADFYFSPLCGDLKDHCEAFRAKLEKREFISVARVLLILTVIQTVCSILQLIL